MLDASTNVLLVDEMTDVICASFAQQKTDASVQLQIIKALLTLITSPMVEVHDTSLSKAVQACFNIFLFSKNVVNQVTAKASLTQIVNLVFQRMERYAVMVVNRASEPRRAEYEAFVLLSCWVVTGK